MKILAADDEKLALDQLTEVIRKVRPEAEITGFQNSGELLQYAKNHAYDVAFLDVEMGAVDGLSVAKQLKIWYPKVNIVFVTAYNEYMEQAIRLRMSGYVRKPVTEEAIREELENLRNPVVPAQQNRLTVKCFGNFDVFADGKRVEFERSKTKEMLAYLVDRRGHAVTSGELRAILWEDAATDDNTGIYLQKLKKDLITSLKKVGLNEAFQTSWNKYAVNPDYLSCDYYDYLENRSEGVRAYNGEYMAQYDWADIQNVLRTDTQTADTQI